MSWRCALTRRVRLCVGVGLVCVLAGCGRNNNDQTAARKAPAATPVVVTKVEQQQVPLELRAIGNVEAFSAVAVKSQVSGIIARVAFEEGQEVQQGQVLFEIDPRAFTQAVREAEAEVSNRK